MTYANNQKLCDNKKSIFMTKSRISNLGVKLELVKTDSKHIDPNLWQKHHFHKLPLFMS
jgi:hypothetical protein